MRVTLIFPQRTWVMRQGGRTLPPNAPYALAAILRREGHEVRVESVPRPDLFAPAFAHELASGCDLLGISANSINWRFARRLTQEVKRARPRLPVVLGGLHPTLFPGHVLETTPADYVVRGEGEEALPELAAALGAGGEVGEVGGLAWRDGDGGLRFNPLRPLLTPTQLAAQPLPAFDLLPAGEYQGLAVESSRGCAFDCVFCSIPYRRNFRALPAAAFVDRLLGSVELARGRLDSPSQKTAVYLLDDCFTTHKKRAVEILERLLPWREQLRFGIEARADQVTEQLARLLARHELWLIQLGIECGYPEGLERVRKGLQLEDVERACALLQEHGLAEAADYAFIIGFPWETKEDCLRTLDFGLYLHLRYGGHLSLSWYEPFPGSRLWNDGLGLGPEIFDEAERDWRRDAEIFARLRPRLRPEDFDELEGVIASIAELDQKFLRGSTADDLDRPSMTRLPVRATSPTPQIGRRPAAPAPRPQAGLAVGTANATATTGGGASP
jgi:radical SAM superfamily enzyme YgiQ (UPF0313 family)